MSFRSIVSDVRDSFGSLSRSRFSVRFPDHHHGKSNSSSHDSSDLMPLVIQCSRWANLPPKLLYDVIKRLEESEDTWPDRKHVVACAGVCRSWRSMCKEIVKGPELCGKLTFPASLKQPGPRDGTIRCFIKRDKSNLTYRLFLCLSPVLLVENGKFLLSARRTRASATKEYVIDTISESSNTYMGKLRSNFLGTKFIIYDSQPSYTTSTHVTAPGHSSRRFTSKKVSPNVPTGRYNIAQISYELNVLGKRGPRRMHCTMPSIPASAVELGGSVPSQPELLLPRSLSFSKSLDHSIEFAEGGGGDTKEKPLILKNRSPRWHQQLQCWCLNFRGRVTVASIKNFQLIASVTGTSSQQTPQPAETTHYDKIILQFGKVGKDMYTMDYQYPLSAFQAFAICLSSFDRKWLCN